ncbi:hypothetical protein CDL15_Pgr010698 [Punica granatum]|uniref:Calponin-homology (CH) domain-containing protein n=1 Tax=Punica granatum TaxID=22663 RepID=A0A218XNW6_PUNGR|nr:hypothetical protein CDL15_Pgr010698 [Punica granatum]
MDPMEPQSSSSSLLLRDISNFKTPRRPCHYKPGAASRSNLQSPSPRFFSASKQTPRTASTARRPSATARRLKAFEIEQSRSSRKAQLQKQHSLRTLSKSLTAWLNFLFDNPRSCGCGSDSSLMGQGSRGMGPSGKGKRDSGPEQAVGLEATWRSPKRQRDLRWKIPEEGDGGSGPIAFSSSAFAKLRDSLTEVCSFDDLVERMSVYLSLDCCKEIFTVMTQVTKNIDDGRLKMKAHCPIVTDFGMKEKATKTLFSYNHLWLRIGLYILLGGDSLLPNGEIESDQDIAFLKMVVEKQFLSHAGLAKSYAYNKKVEGLYRPGYYECLGNVILKRFLLLVLILDRAKSWSSLPLKYGIDGLDGGSPLLFTIGTSVKSSSQMVTDFLSSDVMHGEGNLIAHLVIVGYKVSHHQCPLVEYEFKLVDILEDLQDGVRLCRAVQLLKQDSSILMKLTVPSDTHKKNLANCSIALRYLKEAGVPLYDDDRMEIVADDIANGDKELTLSLLWNMFVHLQAICDNYELKIENLYSLTDGKAIWCLLDHYFRKELSCSSAQKGIKGEESIVSASDYPDAVHSFVLSQRLTALLGEFPEVLEIGDIIEHHGACNGRSVVLLLVFLASQLIMKKNMDQLNFHKLLGCTCQSMGRRLSSHERLNSTSKEAFNLEDRDQMGNQEAARKFREIQAWWQMMADRNSISKPKSSTVDTSSPSTCSNNDQTELAARVIQSHYRGFRERRKFLKMRAAASVLQNAIQSHCRGWLRRKDFLLQREAAITLQSSIRRIMLSTLFQNQRHAASTIQQFARLQISKNRLSGTSCATPEKWSCSTETQELQRVLPHVVKLQRWWRTVLSLRLRTTSAVIIQSYARMWLARREAARERQRVIVIQSYWKGYLARKEARGGIVDLRLRVQKTAANVDDSMRLINRLTAALSELLNLRSVSSILHTCATLDMATRHSQKCCEKLVEVGAIDKLLKVICSMTRSIPDQEVLKHALSTLRNLACYQHLVEVLIVSNGSIETIFREFLRNKDEGYFIASELLKKICLEHRGVEAVRRLPALVKRLNGLVEELKRKADTEKRNARSLAARENTERRLKEASELLKLISI